MDSKVIQLTRAAHRDGNLNIRLCGKDFFPPGVFGGAARKDGLGKLIELHVQGFKTPIRTDIPTDRKTGRPRWIFRERKWLKEFVQFHRLPPGAKVTISRLDFDTYSIALARSRQSSTCLKNHTEPSSYCQELGREYIESSSQQYRKQKGQFFTPPDVARFMANLALSQGESPMRILDPGAGIGILSCAVCEKLAQKDAVTEIQLDLYENDRGLIKYLRKSLEYTGLWLEERGIVLKARVLEEDFVLSGNHLGSTETLGAYDLVISNPPYLKIAADDPRSLSVDEAVHGQPNLYALFMMTGMKALKNGGEMVVITPRSYTSGKYFEAFRRVFFAQMKPVLVHIFNSRKDVFSNQSVLQENIILKAIKGASPRRMVISASTNSSDLHHPIVNKIATQYALMRRGADTILRLPRTKHDMSVLQTVDAWKATLSNSGLQVSTGPVVPFRSKEFLARRNGRDTRDLAPLLWMRNVQPMKMVWPIKNGDARDANYQFIFDCEETRQRRLLLPNGNMVLLRRFSTKDDRRRLVAAPVLKEYLPCALIGIENHLNYIFRPGRPLSADETFGLAAILNSSLLDRYFRICNGNTQVGAAEIRAMPLPPAGIMIELGRELRLLGSGVTQAMIDERLGDAIGYEPQI